MTVKARDARYETIISAAHSLLKPQGYTKAAARLRKGVDGNFAVVQFQKSAWSSGDCFKFTVNFAVVSSRLARENGEDAARIFDEARGHARARIGTFGAPPADIWWTINADDDVDRVIPEVMSLLVIGADYFQSQASDQALARLWELENGPGAPPGAMLLRREISTMVQA